MLTVTIDVPALSRTLCVPRCPRCSFPMNVSFSQAPLTIEEMASGPDPKGEPVKRHLSIFGHCARCMHLEHISTQEVILDQVPASVQSVPGSAPRRSALRRSAAGG